MFIKINKKFIKVKKNNLFWKKFLKNKWEPLNIKIYNLLIKKILIIMILDLGLVLRF